MHTLEFPIITNKEKRKILYKRFRIAWKIKNQVIKYAIKQLKYLRNNKNYRTLLKKYINIKEQLEKEKDPTKEKDLKQQKKAISNELYLIKKQYHLSSKADLEQYAKQLGKTYSKNISSQQVQKIADQVYEGIEDVLYNNGKTLHLKKLNDITTISQKNPNNGIKLKCRYHNNFGRYDDKQYRNAIFWNNEYFIINIDYTDDYVTTALKDEISYCEIKRRIFENGWKYYLVVVLKGNSPKKISHGNEIFGNDPGTSTMAFVGEQTAILRELAPKAKDYEKKIRILQRKADRKLKINNKECLDENGCFIKGKKPEKSENYWKIQRRIRSLYRRRKEYVKQSHEILANEIITKTKEIHSEKMRYRTLQKRAKETVQQKEPSEIKDKNGNTKSIRKYKRKKRFGRSIGIRAPSQFISILKRKCELYKVTFKEIDTVKTKASQYNHVTDDFEKHELKERFKQIGNYTVQRDLYSAYLLKHVNDNNKYDKQALKNNFEQFVSIQDAEITRMKQNNISFKPCFGF